MEACPRCGGLKTGRIEEDDFITYKQYAKQYKKEIEHGSLVYFVPRDTFKRYQETGVNAYCFDCEREFASKETKEEKLNNEEYEEYREYMEMNEMEKSIYKSKTFDEKINNAKWKIKKTFKYFR